MGFWIGLLVAIGVIVIALVIPGAWFAWRIGHEVASPVLVHNPGGMTGKALFLRHPGLGTFGTDAAKAFTEGLAERGWEVSASTLHADSPHNVDAYDLIVLGAPVYAGAPARPLTRYVARVGDFLWKPVVLLLTGAGDTEAARKIGEKAVADAHGRLVRSVTVWSMKPNDEANRYTGSNTERAVQIVRDAARAIGSRA